MCNVVSYISKARPIMIHSHLIYIVKSLGKCNKRQKSDLIILNRIALCKPNDEWCNSNLVLNSHFKKLIVSESLFILEHLSETIHSTLAPVCSHPIISKGVLD